MTGATDLTYITCPICGATFKVAIPATIRSVQTNAGYKNKRGSRTCNGQWQKCIECKILICIEYLEEYR